MSLKEILEDASAEVASWHEGIRGSKLSTFEDKDILGAIEKLESRLNDLQAEAFRRGLGNGC